MAKAKKSGEKQGNGANLGFEAKLWQAADKLRNNMDAGEYKHVVLGLIFLKYISDAFEEHRASLEKEVSDPKSEWYVKEPTARYGALEDRDAYLADNIFWVPKVARWSHLQSHAKQPTIGKLIDDAMVAIEHDNKVLKGVLPKDYARPALDKQRLGELIDLIGAIGLGDRESRSKDILGRVYEYFLGQFANAEGKKGGQFFYTTQIPVCLWFLARDRKNSRFRDRRGQVLFIDARKMGKMIDRTHRELTDDDIARIADTFHAWRGDKECKKKYKDVLGFSKSATLEEIRQHGHVLTPGRYVGAEEVEDDGEPFEEKMKHLPGKLRQQFAESAKLEKTILTNLKHPGF